MFSSNGAGGGAGGVLAYAPNELISGNYFWDEGISNYNQKIGINCNATAIQVLGNVFVDPAAPVVDVAFGTPNCTNGVVQSNQQLLNFHVNLDPTALLTLRAGLTIPWRGGHIENEIASNDVNGTIAIVSSTSASKTFTRAYASVPTCQLTPATDPTAIGVYWSTATTTAVTANIKTAGTITFNYHEDGCQSRRQ